MKRTKSDMLMSDTTQAPRNRIARHIPLLVILTIAVAGFFTLGDFLSFETLRDNREALLAWRDANYWALAGVFVSLYIVIVAFSLPGAAVASMTGGFLFGLLAGTLFNVFAATRRGIGHLSGGAVGAGRNADSAAGSVRRNPEKTQGRVAGQ